METLLEKLKDIIKDTEDIFIRIEIDSIKPDNSLTEDLGLDSLGKVNLFYEIIDTLGRDDSEEVLEKWNLVSDIIAYMEKK